MELFPSRTQSTKRRLEDRGDTKLHEAKRPHLETTPIRRGYQRQPKPPYTYVGMMTVAIQTSPSRRLTLPEIQEALENMFPFFRGQYTGWRDSVRHFLSSSPCFIKISRNHTSSKSTKGNHWSVDLSRVPADVFKRMKVKPELETTWAPTLTEQLKIPDIVLPPSSDPPRRIVRALKKSTTTSPTKEDPASLLLPGHPATAPSLSYTEAQYTRYLREQTPSHTQVHLNQYPPFATLLYQTMSFDYTEAASNLHRLCPEPVYGSPTPTPRDCSTHASTPKVRQELQFETPESARPITEPTSCVPTDSRDSSLSELAAFFTNFANSLAETETYTPPTDVQQLVKEETSSSDQPLTTLQDYHQLPGPSYLNVQHVDQTTPASVREHITSTRQPADPVPDSIQPTSSHKGEITSECQLPVLSFNDLPLSPDGAYSYF